MDSNTCTDAGDLKVKELLKEVRLDWSSASTKLVDDTISAIKEAIDNIPEDLKVTADVAPGFVRGVGADEVEFNFRKPKVFQVGGSYSIGCVAKPDVNIDLFVRMPKACFSKKDYLCHRYHAKRCLYLCVIKKYLKLSSSTHKVEWSTLQTEARKPVLIVFPAAQHSELPGFFVRIIPSAKSLFNLAKLNLEQSNIDVKQEGNAPQATPKYNSSILEDMFLEDNAEIVRRAFLGWEELTDALILLKVWARQRASIWAHDCLNGYLISVILSYLVIDVGGNHINKSMKAMQIFRVMLNFIATSKLWDKGLSFQSQGQQDISKEGRRAIQERKQLVKSLFPVIICDPSARFNLAFRMSQSGFMELQDEASLTLSCINNCRDGGFEEIFMTKVDFPAKYDCCIRLNLKGNSEVYASGFCLDDECWRLYEQKVHSFLNQGLGDRAKHIRVCWRNTLSECNMEDGFSMFDRELLLVGISISSLEKAFQVVDVGPDAENKEEVLKFRKFWGDKAELRRFKDGRIAESTVWECAPWERHHVIKRISEYVLLQHFALSKESMVHIVDQLDFSLHDGVEDPISSSGSLIEAFEILSKRLRLLNDIPLRVSSVQPLDPAFRFTAVYPPKPHPLANEKGLGRRLQQSTSTCIQPLEVMIQLEGSGNWPMDAVAFERTKHAFLLKIGESLQDCCGLTCIATENDVDFLMSGYAFRLKILHERGLSLVKKQVGNDQVQRVASTDKKLFLQSQHSSMINGLQGRYPIYSPVVRLAKRWIASHLFSASLAEEAIELLVARLFLNPLPFRAPCSRITGFLRFLRLLAEYDWTFSAFVVDINGDFTSDDRREIDENFKLSRKAQGENLQTFEPAMFLATSYDKSSEAWTRSSPNLSELKRLVAYARSSANLLSKLILHDQIDSYRWECLFRTPLNNYDAVVLIHRDRLPYPHHLLFPSDLNQGKHVASGNATKSFSPFISPRDIKANPEKAQSKVMVDFDPLKCLLGDLEKEFPSTFKVWYDSLGGDAIGLTWERYSSKKRGREETTGEEGRDLIEVLKAVGEVGKGFVRSVYFLKAPRLRN